MADPEYITSLNKVGFVPPPAKGIRNEEHPMFKQPIQLEQTKQLEEPKFDFPSVYKTPAVSETTEPEQLITAEQSSGSI